MIMVKKNLENLIDYKNYYLFKKYMVTKEILMSHPISTLRKEVSKTNVRGYSKLKKAEIIDLMMKNKEKFAHIKTRLKPSRKLKNK